MLIDSDVLVWLTRGHRVAAVRLRALATWRISAVTYMELAQGCRGKTELSRLPKALDARGTEIVPITPVITRRAIAPMEQRALPHGMRLTDALIASTAVAVERNRHHCGRRAFFVSRWAGHRSVCALSARPFPP
ncbi:MAG: PIN domain-containing protein [Rubrivivax sp.]|nr:PIN domain-containing protein [Rubrivivax sp.]